MLLLLLLQLLLLPALLPWLRCGLPHSLHCSSMLHWLTLLPGLVGLPLAVDLLLAASLAPVSIVLSPLLRAVRARRSASRTAGVSQ